MKYIKLFEKIRRKIADFQAFSYGYLDEGPDVPEYEQLDSAMTLFEAVKAVAREVIDGNLKEWMIVRHLPTYGREDVFFGSPNGGYYWDKKLGPMADFIDPFYLDGDDASQRKLYLFDGLMKAEPIITPDELSIIFGEDFSWLPGGKDGALRKIRAFNVRKKMF